MLNLSFADSSFSIIVTSTFLIIAIITFLSLSRHYKVFVFLKSLLKDMETAPTYSVFLQKCKNDYDLVTENGTKVVDKESFIESFMSDYKMENGKSLVKPLKSNQSAGNIVILIGVLGTFVGLVLALSDINYSEMNESVLQLLAGIHTAFYTSIFGIFASIVIHFFTKRYHADQLLMQVMFKMENFLNVETVSNRDEKMIHILTDVKDAIYDMKNSLSGLGEFSSQFEEASQHLHQFNDQFGKNADKMIDHFTDVKQLGQMLNENVGKLDHHFTAMSESFSLQESLVKDLKSNLQTYANELKDFSGNQTASQQKLLEAVGQFLGTAKEQKTQLQSFLSSFKAEVQQIFEQTARFYEETMSGQKQLVSTQERLEHKNGELIKNVERATAGMKEIVDQGAFQQIGEFASNFSRSIQKLDSRFQQFGQFLQKIDQKDQEFVQLLSENSGTFSRIQSQLRDDQKAMASVLQNIVSQNELVDVSMKDIVQILKAFDRNGAVMVDKMKQMTEDMNQRFFENDRMFQKTTSELRQLLEEFTEKTMANMEKALRQSHETIGTSIERVISQTNSAKGNNMDHIIHQQNEMIANNMERMASQMNEAVGSNLERMIRQSNDTFAINMEKMLRSTNDAVNANGENVVRQLERQIDLMMSLLDKKFDAMLQQMDQQATAQHRNIELLVRELQTNNRRREQAGM